LIASDDRCVRATPTGTRQRGDARVIRWSYSYEVTETVIDLAISDRYGDSTEIEHSATEHGLGCPAEDGTGGVYVRLCGSTKPDQRSKRSDCKAFVQVKSSL